ncbi:hypothetical protein [Mycoplasma sp. P36-A1]|uniref:hypothetical protein n=1 Tax=Mycoplasma sp. P36-A1 TaxID=3252900 RepID=UPI003C2E8B7C
MKKLYKLSLSCLLLVGLSACSSANAASDALITMADQSVNKTEIFNQAKIDSKGEGFFDLIDSQLLAANYSIDKNNKVKEKVETQKKTILESNPDILSQYDVKDMDELVLKAGIILSAQREQYAKDQFNKEFVNDASLKALYDKKAGELVSYTVVELDETLFDNDEEKLKESVAKIKETLSTVTAENVEETFTTLAKEYPGDESTITNGKKESVSRDDVDDKVLAKLDSLKYKEFTKDPVVDEDKYYFIYKSNNDERLSFEASKERLRDLQYEQATEANSYMDDYFLYKLRSGAKITFPNSKDQKTYNMAMAAIKTNYDDAAKEEK